MTTVERMMQDAATVIVDVRTPSEFAGGHVAGSINIPLNEVPARLDEFRQMPGIVLCCASGGRSGNAELYLKQHNINCCNGGPWTLVNYIKNNKA